MAPQVLLWLTDADAVSEEALHGYRGWLTPGELARDARFVRQQRRRQFIVGRALLRLALSRVLDVAPRAVRLEEQTGRAPKLVAPVAGGIGFSIAHSGRWVGCAVSTCSALGLDIELRDPERDFTALAGQAFSEAEMAQWLAMSAMPKAMRVEAFYRLWCEKEARFKLGREEAVACIALQHEELSVVLCSDPPLGQAPQMEVVTLPRLLPEPVP